MAPSLVSTTASVVPVASPAWAARGRSTSIASRTMYVAVTMKMMRRTSVMSTSGVTLMPLIISSSPSPPTVTWLATLAPPRGRRPEPGDHRMAQRRRALRRAAQPSLVQVEHDHRRQRHEEADRRGDERVGDARHDGARARGAGMRREVGEGADHAQHRPEEADEGRVVPERAEEREAPLVLEPRPLHLRVHHLRSEERR